MINLQTNKPIMTQLVVDIEDGYSVMSLKKAIALLRGVTKVMEQKPSAVGGRKRTLAAMEDVKAGRTIKCADFEDYLEKVK